MNYTIYYTGSKGNSNLVEINNRRFLIDCGVPFKWLEKTNLFDKPIDYLLITHKHSDHINVSTYNRLRLKYPKMKVITNKEVNNHLLNNNSHFKPHYIVESGVSMFIDSLEISFIENAHGVDTQGYVFSEFGKTLLYATDLSTTAYYEQFLDRRNQKLDVCLLENNYDMDKLLEMLNTHTGYNLAEAQSRHLEHKEFLDFISKYCYDYTRIEELHQSSSLY